ncbi:MAG: amidohydrolase family protein [Candidatus Hydrogenedentes bacterium]|nr:amidohydrolase family protein [Candidatus Hydrogenedentota bacterium]
MQPPTPAPSAPPKTSIPDNPPPRIINVHEHIQSLREAPKLLAAMDQVGIAKTVLVGSSWFTITLNQKVGFTRYDQNNEELLKIVRAYPGRFEAWPTVNPNDPEKLEKFEQLVERGATGLKLYLGHGLVKKNAPEYFFHTMALDDPRMRPLYAFCQERNVPICFHVNPGPKTPGFAEEFVAVLSAYPDLKVICPHFMLSSIKESRLREFLDTFPNLYTDISFGHDDYLRDGLRRVSKDTPVFRKLIADYPDRFMFGTDVVVTEARFKTTPWMMDRCRAYIDLMTKEDYTTPLLPDETLNGLALSGDLLEKLLHQNFEAFQAKQPQGTQITRQIDWNNMGLPKTGRAPGTALPAPRQEAIPKPVAP